MNGTRHYSATECNRQRGVRLASLIFHYAAPDCAAARALHATWYTIQWALCMRDAKNATLYGLLKLLELRMLIALFSTLFNNDTSSGFFYLLLSQHCGRGRHHLNFMPLFINLGDSIIFAIVKKRAGVKMLSLCSALQECKLNNLFNLKQMPI